MTAGVFQTPSKCRCGSRQWACIDYHKDEHCFVCENKHHEDLIGDAMFLKPENFFCACGGFFLDDYQCIYVSREEGRVPIMLDFHCPLCNRIIRLKDTTEGNKGIKTARESYGEVFSARDDLQERMLKLAEKLLIYSEGRRGLLVQLKMMIWGLGDRRESDPSDTNYIQFANAVKELRQNQGQTKSGDSHR